MREKIKDNARLHHMIEAIDNAKRGKVIISHSFDEYKNAMK
jgi:hypothetical protein